ncbi:histidine phosphatase family protein [Nonomuraea sp. NPDC048826]|uniref:histidine phosphatase family protein n=1 Tax=Nonomuraea sp. NPDC048826 TaxID=3364347 RepID=UPI00371BEEE1
MSVRLVYETHATTVDNERGIATGHLPGELSAVGREQARELGERRRGVEVVYASDLGRAVETVELAFGGVREVRFDARLRECDYGDLTGRPVRELAPLRVRHIDVPWPGGESYRQVVARTAAFLRDVRSDLNDVRDGLRGVPDVGDGLRGVPDVRDGLRVEAGGPGVPDVGDGPGVREPGDASARWQGRTVLVVAHAANRWALLHLLAGTPLEELVTAPFQWRPGWEFELEAG